MVTIDCPPQILVVSDNRKGLISNAVNFDKIVFNRLFNVDPII